MANLAVGLRNLAECLGHARAARAGPGRRGRSAHLRPDRRRLGGDPQLRMRTWDGSRPWPAIRQRPSSSSLAADQIEVAEEPEVDHLYSIRGTWWADFLALTGRQDPALVLTRRNIDICRRYGWNDDVARCDRVLGRLALAAGDTAAAGGHLAAAAAVFRDGDYLTELAATLADLAEHARVSGDLEAPNVMRPRRSPSPPPAGWCPPTAPRWPPAPASAPTRATAGDPDPLYSGPRRRRRRAAARHPPPARLVRTRRAARPRRCSTRPKGSTRAGPPRPTPCTPGWSRPAWTPTRWPPSNGSSPPRKPPKPTEEDED